MRNYKYVKNCNIILIVIDSLRADHLGCYGYKRNISPNIDKMANEGVIFSNAISQAPHTLPSVATILTSLYPPIHEALVGSNSIKPLDAQITTLAETLKKNSYSTGAFVGGVQLAKECGLNKGFDIYQDKNAYIRENARSALKWLNNNRTNKSFLFLHCLNTHIPYCSQFNYKEYSHCARRVNMEQIKKVNKKQAIFDVKDKENIITLYDNEVRIVDTELKWFLNELKKLDIFDKSLIIFTADHGDEFGEHGYFAWHSHTLYDELLKVPLIIKIPDLEQKKKICNQVRLIDIMPTILEILGIPFYDQIQGKSLLPFIMNKNMDDLDAYSFLNEMISLRTNKWKLIKLKETFELYNLKNNSRENKNLIKTEELQAKKLKEKIDNQLEINQSINLRYKKLNKKVECSQKLRERLRALGYL